MKRSAIWFSAILALVAATLSGLFVFSDNSGPPPIAQGAITKEDGLYSEAASRRLTEVLQSKFPIGSREDILKSILLKQGFRAVEPPPSNCMPPGQQVPIGMGYLCLTPEQREKRKRTLEYKWVRIVGCIEFISVTWSSEKLGALTHVEGSYRVACL